MNRNNFIADISEQRLTDIDKERTETMSTKKFKDWVKELRVSATYIDPKLHIGNATSMMNMIGKQRWIEIYTQVNKTNN